MTFLFNLSLPTCRELYDDSAVIFTIDVEKRNINEPALHDFMGVELPTDAGTGVRENLKIV